MTVEIQNPGEADEALRTNGEIRLPCTDKGICGIVQETNLSFFIHLPTGSPEL